MRLNILRKHSFQIALCALISAFFMGSANRSAAQVVSPCDANPFCSDTAYTFENATSGSISSSISMGCLGSAPRPIWYYMEIGVAGTLELLLEQFTEAGMGIDVDFAMYGPYESLEEGCLEILDGDFPLQCSYSGSYTETLGIGATGGAGTGMTTPPPAEVGEVYIVLITNFSGMAGYISFSQTGGTGATNCSIICGLSASNDGPKCQNEPITLEAQNADTATVFSYYWSGSDGSSYSGPSVTILPPVGTTTYSLIAVSEDGDTCRAETQTTVYPLPNVTLANTEDQTLCNIGFYKLKLASPSGSTSYQWYRDGEPIEGATLTEYTATTNGNYYVVGITNNGCEATSPDVNLSFNTTDVNFSFELNKGCVADTVVFTNLSEAGTYRWHYDDGTTPPDDTTTHPTHIYHNQNEYIVRLTVTDLDGCVDSIRKVIDTRHPLAASFTQSADSICQSGDNFISFTNTSIGNIKTWNWDFGDGQTSTAKNPTNIYTLAGTHTVRLIVTDDVPCSDTVYSTVYIDSIPYFELVADKDSICNGDRINFALDYLYTTQSLTWDFGDGTGLENLQPQNYHSYDEPGTYNVTVTTHQPVCAGLTAQATIVVKPYPVVNLGPDTTVCPNGTPVGIASKSYMTDPQAIKWLWSTGSTNPVIRVVEPGTYTLTADLNGCKTSDEIEVLKDCYTDIPNSFTPNGDGHNDYFLPRQFLSRGVTEFSMTIFDRWGQKIFETRNIDGRGWDGKFNDKDQPVGVYIYQISVTYKDGIQENATGNLTLLR
jgi:gliding motility-associated-like protein